MLLSPGLPRLPGGLEPLPPAEPPLTHEEFAPRPPPLPCAPIPPEIAAKLAAGKMMEVALEGWRKKSQLAWVMEQMRREEEEAAAAEAVAEAAAEAAAAAQQVWRCCSFQGAGAMVVQCKLAAAAPPAPRVATPAVGPPAARLRTG